MARSLDEALNSRLIANHFHSIGHQIELSVFESTYDVFLGECVRKTQLYIHSIAFFQPQFFVTKATLRPRAIKHPKTLAVNKHLYGVLQAMLVSSCYSCQPGYIITP